MSARADVLAREALVIPEMEERFLIAEEEANSSIILELTYMNILWQLEFLSIKHESRKAFRQMKQRARKRIAGIDREMARRARDYTCHSPYTFSPLCGVIADRNTGSLIPIAR